MRAVYYPRDPQLAGRAAVIWYHWAGYDVVLVTVYGYVQVRQGYVGGDTKNRLIWNWVTKHHQLVPMSATVCVMCDANGHVGSQRWYGPDCPWAPNNKDEDYPHIGPYGK